MTTQTLVVELPAHIVRELRDLAARTQMTPEKLAALSIEGNLPPSIPNVSIEWQEEFLAMQYLSIEELRQIGYSQLPTTHLELLEKKSERTISTQELQELRTLREAADRHMLKKAYAWAVLRWRGIPVPKFPPSLDL